MDNLEKMLEKYLEKVDRLTKEYELAEEEYLKFKKEAAEILYNAAIKRNKFRMAIFF